MTFEGDTDQSNNVFTGSSSRSNNVFTGSGSQSNNVFTDGVTTQFPPDVVVVQLGFDYTFDFTFA